MSDKAAFQVIVLGATGGPREDSVTGLLVRSTSTNWAKNSVVAVDAGTLLAGIIRTLDRHLPVPSRNEAIAPDRKPVMREGPFVGLQLPNLTAQANAAYIFREIIASVLITHPHLDHISGLAMNTPLVESGSGPKTVAALPSAIAAIKNHVFNDITWPNLSDEDGGAGLVTYRRLSDGGNPRFGTGEGKGYVKACEGLVTKCLGVSHGRCRQRYHPESAMHHRAASTVFTPEHVMFTQHHLSLPDVNASESSPYSPDLRRTSGSTTAKDLQPWAAVESSAFFIRDDHTGSEIIIFGDLEPDSISLEPRNKLVWEAAAPKIASGVLRAIFIECSYSDEVDDSALYGHLCPRHLVAELSVLAKKVTQSMAGERSSVSTGKRKRESLPQNEAASPSSPSCKSRRTSSPAYRSSVDESNRRLGRRSRPSLDVNHAGHGHDSTHPIPQAQSSSGLDVPELVHDMPTPCNQLEPTDHEDDQGDEGGNVDDLENDVENEYAPTFRADYSFPANSLAAAEYAAPFPLSGLSVYIIHVKDTLTDGPPPSIRILQELRRQGEEAKLGCEFFVSKSGEGIWI